MECGCGVKGERERSTTSLSGSEKHVYLDQRHVGSLQTSMNAELRPYRKFVSGFGVYTYSVRDPGYKLGLHLVSGYKGTRIQYAFSLDTCKRKA